ncbi:MAG: DNA primase [Bacilli bacterium]|nr:DNA primase [Bacilli bacterium]
MNNSSNTNESLIQKVIDNSDIVEVIGEYINLEKKGNDYKGLCPFHNDSNPSLSVSPQKKVFKCFSCNAAGNVISFVQRIENISFMDALKKVANKSGIKLNLKENPHEQRRQKYYKILNDATSAYEFYLHNTNEGKKALEYLEKRHISLDVIKKFRIGLSSHNENIICKVLLEQNKYLPIDLKEVGLIDDDTNGKEVDLFHGRIMFPITDLKGNVVGFSGRVYDRESNSKYLNTKENEIFKKKEILFNYSSCVNDIKMLNHVFVFEGFMDVIACYRAGINNAIATMGTSLTENQVEIISSLTNNITLCYDGDNPGIEASKRAIKMFMKKNISLSSIVLPEGLDPDDYINKFGKEAFLDLFNNHRVSSIDYLYEIAKKKLDRSNPNSLIAFQKEVYNIIKEINNPSLNSYLLNKLSSDLAIDKSKLENDLSSYSSSKALINDIRKSNKSKEQTYERRNYEEAEKGIVYLSFYNRDVCMKVRKKLAIDEFINSINRNILFALYEYYDLSKEMDKDEFLKTLDPLELDTLNTIINTCQFYNVKCLDDFITYMKNANNYKTDLYLRKKINNETDTEKYTQFLDEFIKNKKSLIKIKKNKE